MLPERSNGRSICLVYSFYIEDVVLDAVELSALNLDVPGISSELDIDSRGTHLHMNSGGRRVHLPLEIRRLVMPSGRPSEVDQN